MPNRFFSKKKKRKKEKKRKGFMPTYKLFIKDHYSPIYINLIGRGRWILGRGHCIIIIIILTLGDLN